MDNYETSENRELKDEGSSSIYLCTACSFAVSTFGMMSDLPKCPCCESESYIPLGGSVKDI